jgi:hypothetical protein
VALDLKPNLPRVAGPTSGRRYPTACAAAFKATRYRTRPSTTERWASSRNYRFPDTLRGSPRNPLTVFKPWLRPRCTAGELLRVGPSNRQLLPRSPSAVSDGFLRAIIERSVWAALLRGCRVIGRIIERALCVGPPARRAIALPDIGMVVGSFWCVDMRSASGNAVQLGHAAVLSGRGDMGLRQSTVASSGRFAPYLCGIGANAQNESQR